MVRFWASDMVLNIHSSASYLSEPKACSQACSHFFMGSIPSDRKPIKLNGTCHTLCSILRCVVASAAEEELGALFMNCQEGMIFKAPSKILDIPNQNYRYTATTQKPSASRITPLNTKDCVQWKWSISGHVKKMHRKCFCWSGNQGWKILQTTKANTTPVDITQR